MHEINTTLLFYHVKLYIARWLACCDFCVRKPIQHCEFVPMFWCSWHNSNNTVVVITGHCLLPSGCLEESRQPFTVNVHTQFKNRFFFHWKQLLGSRRYSPPLRSWIVLFTSLKAITVWECPVCLNLFETKWKRTFITVLVEICIQPAGYGWCVKSWMTE